MTTTLLESSDDREMRKVQEKEDFEFGTYEDGRKATINLPKLIKTRLMIEASSGGGKSWLMRKLIELFFGYVQQIIIDPEGEFSSLREKFPFVLASAERDDSGMIIGEVEADPSTADVLAHTILKTRASIIIDISELSIDEKKRYVNNFVQALVQSPKELWHPCLIWIDESHDFAPQSSHGESESLGAIKDLASKGRKRGQALILATQRLSKLSKDAAAELKNYLIGNTNLDLDQERASDILGFSSKTQRQELRTLEPGVFWVSGSAFNSGLAKLKVGKVLTHHPEAAESGSQYVPPPTPEQVKPLLSTLHQIPVVKKRNLEEKRELLAKIRDQQNQIQSLSAKLRIAESAKNQIINPEQAKLIEERAYARGQKAMEQQVSSRFKQVQALQQKYQRALLGIGKIVSDNAGLRLPEINVSIPVPVPNSIRTVPKPAVRTEPAQSISAEAEFGRCERAVLKFLAMRPDREFTKQQIGAMTNYSPTSGGFNNSISKLNVAGLVKCFNGTVSLSQERIDEVVSILGDEYCEPSKDALEAWLQKLDLAPRKIYELLLRNPDQVFTKQEIADQTRYSATSGGFNNAISELNTLGLIEKTAEGIRLNQELRGI